MNKAILLITSIVLASSSPAAAEDQSLAHAKTPKTPVEAYPKNGCIACHASLPGKLSQAVQDWSASIHFQNQITCDSCHGGDPDIAGQPDNRQAIDSAHHSLKGFIHRPKPASKVSYFCGKCHVAIMEKHLGSPHGENTHPTCIYCHGHHDIHSPTTGIINTERCTVCHDFKTAERIKGLLEDTEAQIQKIAEQAKWLEKHGYKNLALEEMHEHSKGTVTQLRIAFHSFNLRDINNFTNQITTVAEQTVRTVDLIQNKSQAAEFQTLIGLGVTVYLFLFAVFLMGYKRHFLNHHGSAKSKSGGFAN
ncbi:MAG: hypothetical protein HY717_04595 [Planctomycetes bacterium]|nr:hypothetical protein [Planctomycetota bacterium]